MDFVRFWWGFPMEGLARERGAGHRLAQCRTAPHHTTPSCGLIDKEQLFSSPCFPGTLSTTRRATPFLRPRSSLDCAAHDMQPPSAMATIDRCLASMAKLSLVQASRPTLPLVPRFLAPAYVQSRQASVIRIKKPTKKRTVPKDFRRHNLDKTDFPRFSLLEAMRYARKNGSAAMSIKTDKQ